MMFANEEIIQCPIQGPHSFTACPDDEVTPLIEFLRSGVAVIDAVAFPRGTLLPDGRLDLCKQSLGTVGCRRIVAALKGNNHIKSLLLGTDGIGDQGAEAVGELVESNTAIQIVYLGCNGITQIGTQSLADSLADNSSVEGLWLKRNPIGDEGAEAIADLISCNHHIRVLDLVNTAIGERGIQRLCESLMQSDCSIERLYLGGNLLDTNAAKRLAEVLRCNRRLQSLLLSVGMLGDDGADALATGLAGNQTLRELGLASNGITDIGLRPLLRAVTNHPSLTNLDLGYSRSTKVLGAEPNTLGDEGGEWIAEMLRTNSTLTRLNLSRTEIGPNGKASIESSLLVNFSIQHCLIDGGLSQAVRDQLRSNQQSSPASSHPTNDVTLIRSVYRTAKR